VVLLDDFSASGSSYYMLKQDGTIGGKIAKFFRGLKDPAEPVSRLVDLARVEVVILLYMATDQARNHLRACSARLWGEAGVRWSVEVVQFLPGDLRLAPGAGNPVEDLIDGYYDHDGVWDSHLAKGGTADAKYGYATCGLPLVLHHNTPNNSIVLLWSYEGTRVRGLFPRVKRHKETP
jgi:hypothetical protein